ncbi:hypothetical protein MPH_06926 [Macrophomina phaseolina MS6]|uniref:Uncharacterized protein n=1 Tax=Macrophomina phaseolina (strain MS6) TaxID=1126212 RepID=K2SGJ7_MACPH|nr:hypothetical protein MPH_06926 [Macrophomina phaseolina MS6]
MGAIEGAIVGLERTTLERILGASSEFLFVFFFFFAAVLHLIPLQLYGGRDVLHDHVRSGETDEWVVGVFSSVLVRRCTKKYGSDKAWSLRTFPYLMMASPGKREEASMYEYR